MTDHSPASDEAAAAVVAVPEPEPESAARLFDDRIDLARSFTAELVARVRSSG